MLLDRNRSIVEALGVTDDVYRIDLTTDAPPQLGAAAAIVDPPWYPTDTQAFLAATNRVCAHRARIVLCQPTLATRPGVAEERAALLDELPRLGFCYRSTAAPVRYQMPHFEASSLKVAAPELLIPTDWRVGDVLILERSATALRTDPQGMPAETWQEVIFGPARIKLRRTEPPNLGSLVPGHILDTVSRRDLVRQRIGLWTSGNRVFTLADPAAIGRLIQLGHADVMLSRFTPKRILSHARTVGVGRRVAHRLFDLLLIELQEHTLQKEAETS